MICGSNQICVDPTPPPCYAERSFDPNCYDEGIPITVSINVTPEAGTQVYAVEDTPPAGWMVSNINEGGTWDDVNKKVKWGLFFDSTVRTLAYDVVAPVDAAGCYSFSGIASFDGVDTSVCLDNTICECAPPLPVTYAFDPNSYSSGSPVSVIIDVTPDTSVQVYAVEDAPPSGWTVDPNSINEGGAWEDVNKKVKWGLFFDANIRTLSYDVTPPVGETGEKTFSGTASFDGIDEPFGRTISPQSCATVADFDDDCDVDLADLMILAGNWLAGTQ